jgi:CheY-like chemotaxis protein
VATDVVADADQVKDLLRKEFDNVVVSIDPDRAIEDFEKHRPAVLVLAFDSLQKAERYYLGLYRRSGLVPTVPHSTLILCNKDDLTQAYELCKKRHFDDYMLFWPMTHDTLRLPMAVHHLVRQMTEGAAGRGTAGEMALQARRIGELESVLEDYAVRGGVHVEVASLALQQARQDIGTALHGFSRTLVADAPGGAEGKVRAGLQRKIDHLRMEEIDKRFAAIDAAVQPVRQWVGGLRQEFAPQLNAASALVAMADRIRPVILVVDDDEFQNKLLAKILTDARFDATFATTGAEALALLRKRRPDLILMDVNLPDLNGVEITRRIKSVEPFAGIPVVMVTGQSGKHVIIDSLKAGAANFVVKPINKDILLEKIRKCLNERSRGHTEGP